MTNAVSPKNSVSSIEGAQWEMLVERGEACVDSETKTNREYATEDKRA